ncbi:hypothetical protein [Kitasatospora kifunensis]|uniref:Uncharacterized protein n=1 Tax=Kitasatospora kifunensis TaxID=58351 RepID=A0A7W7VZY4_KITKI|nr:hypothetical protein [Kitasatospora kifunensis]MBB4929041.1 hypothetical protein [Kitasatospora kifunensis]
MDFSYLRTENGTPRLVTPRAALDEINAGMMDKAVKRTIREMSAARGAAHIKYRDGRTVHLRPLAPEELARHLADLTHLRTENGIPALVSTTEAQAEFREAMLDRVTVRAHVRKIEGNEGGYDITYTDDRHVTLRPATPEETGQPAAPAMEYRTLKGAKIGDTLTLWTRGGKKGPDGSKITVTIAGASGGWYVTSVERPTPWFLGGTASKYWIVG